MMDFCQSSTSYKGKKALIIVLILSTLQIVINHHSWFIPSSTYLHHLFLTLNPLYVTEMLLYTLLKLDLCQIILGSNGEVKHT